MFCERIERECVPAGEGVQVGAHFKCLGHDMAWHGMARKQDSANRESLSTVSKASRGHLRKIPG